LQPYRLGLWDHQNPPKKGGFFYFTGLVAKQVAREGFSGEMSLRLNLNEVENQNIKSRQKKEKHKPLSFKHFKTLIF
jgi:hypothetical protein